MVFISALSRQINIPEGIINHLTDLINMLGQRQDPQEPVVTVEQRTWPGRPWLHVTRHLLEMQPVPTITKLKGVSRCSIFRRLNTTMSVTELYRC